MEAPSQTRDPPPHPPKEEWLKMIRRLVFMFVGFVELLILNSDELD